MQSGQQEFSFTPAHPGPDDQVRSSDEVVRVSRRPVMLRNSRRWLTTPPTEGNAQPHLHDSVTKTVTLRGVAIASGRDPLLEVVRVGAHTTALTFRTEWRPANPRHLQGCYYVPLCWIAGRRPCDRSRDRYETRVESTKIVDLAPMPRSEVGFVHQITRPRRMTLRTSALSPFSTLRSSPVRFYILNAIAGPRLTVFRARDGGHS